MGPVMLFVEEIGEELGGLIPCQFAVRPTGRHLRHVSTGLLPDHQ